MPTRVADLLDHAREQSFVGRRAELATFGEALAGQSGKRVLFLHGPGGIGKSTTLEEFGRRARALGRTVAFVDGREVDPVPDAFLSALGPAEPAVLLIDGYERLAPIDEWLRREFLPARSDRDVVVLAGREPPAAAWRTDPGWRRLAAIRRLDPLDPADSAELLARAGVAEGRRPALIALGRGHPLAMALLADTTATGAVPRSLADVPDLISALLECLVREPPTDAHAAGLATCAKAWLTTEDLLRETVGADAPAVWSWLQRRPFIACGPRGLRPHELARDVLDAEFERRSPDRYRALHRIIHDHAVAAIRGTHGPDRQLRAQHLLYLHRNSPLTATFFEMRERGSIALVPGGPADHEAVLAMVSRFEGPVSVALCREWLAEWPGGLSVVPGEDGLRAFVHHVTLPRGTALEDRDPVTVAVLRHVAAAGPLRPGERIDLARFLAGVEEHQRDRYAVLAGAVSSILEWVGRPRAWSFVATSDPEFWQPMFDYLAFSPCFEATVDGVRHVGFGMDWRRLPVDTWLDLMNEREQSGGTGPPPAALLRPPPIGPDAFAAAVRQALHDLHRPAALAANPLAAGRPDLRAAIEAAVAALGDEPKGDALRAVLTRTHLRPAPSQEAAASVLGLPFSTYRRHLAKAVDRLTELLWSVEIGAAPDHEQRMGSD